MFNLLSAERVYFSDTFEPVAKWLTIGLIGAILLVYLSMVLVEFLKKLHRVDENKLSNKFIKGALIFFVFYALALGILLLVLEIMKKFDTAYLEENWVSLDVIGYVLVPLLITLSLALIGAVVFFILTKLNCKHKKTVTTIIFALVGISLIVSLVLIGIHYSSNIQGDGYYTDETTGKLNPTALYLFAFAIIVFTVILALFLGRNDKAPFDTHAIAFAGICVSLSFALSYIKLWDMPTGGSVTLVSLLPVMLFAFVYGTKKGLLVGFLYGILQAIQDPWLIHPAQFLLDYPIAFSMVCLAGLLTDLNCFKSLPQARFAFSALIAGTFRFICHVLSGVFAFGAYASDAGATSFWTYSLIYNCYVFIDVALVILAGTILLSSRSFNHELNKLKGNRF